MGGEAVQIVMKNMNSSLAARANTGTVAQWVNLVRVQASTASLVIQLPANTWESSTENGPHTPTPASTWQIRRKLLPSHQPSSSAATIWAVNQQMQDFLSLSQHCLSNTLKKSYFKQETKLAFKQVLGKLYSSSTSCVTMGINSQGSCRGFKDTVSMRAQNSAQYLVREQTTLLAFDLSVSFFLFRLLISGPPSSSGRPPR